MFETIGDANFCPLIAYNMCVKNHWLFYQLNSNFDQILTQCKLQYNDDYTVVTLRPNNQLLQQKLTDSFAKIVFVDSYEQAENLTGNLVVLGETLGNYCKRFAKNIKVINLCQQNKMEKLCQCIDITVNRKEAIDHDIQI